MKLTLVLLAASLAFAAAALSTTKGTATTKGTSTSTSKSSKSVGDGNFKDWKQRNGKKYSTSKSQGKTETEAEKTFKDNVAKIAKHNSDVKATYKQAANSNADLTPEEIKKSRKGLRSDSNPKGTTKAPNSNSIKTTKGSKSNSKNSTKGPNFKSTGKTFQKSSNTFNTAIGPKYKASWPNSLDYRSEMSPVKDQGTCGSDWAFAVVSTLEYWSRKNASNKMYSEQYLVDCDSSNFGCDGGNPLNAFYYTMMSGISESHAYAYVAQTQNCKSKSIPPSYYLQNLCFVDLKGDETMLKLMLIKYGPLVVGLNTNGTGFDFYSSGVFNDAACSSDPLKADHSMTLVGYGTDATAGDFWLVRNSWGTGYGEQGYIRVARNKANLCGIANIISAPCPLQR